MSEKIISIETKRYRAVMKFLDKEVKLRKARQFTRRAKHIYKRARSRSEITYGTKPWYCSVDKIENGADVVFIGANPGGRKQAWKDDLRSGGLEAPYEKRRHYQAWLDDEHWGTSGDKQRGLQARVLEAFDILFSSDGESTLRNAASFNVVPMRSNEVDKLSRQTWNEGAKWCLDVLDHISPSIIVCLGNGKRPGRSAWSVVADERYGFGIREYEERPVNGTYNLKRGLASLKEKDALVIGLPHLSYPVNMRNLREAAVGWEIKSDHT